MADGTALLSYEIARKSFSIDRHVPPFAGGMAMKCPSIFPIDGLHNASALMRADSEQPRCHVAVNTSECRIGETVDAMENLSSPRHPPLASLDLMPSVYVSRADRTTWRFRYRVLPPRKRLYRIIFLEYARGPHTSILPRPTTFTESHYK